MLVGVVLCWRGSGSWSCKESEKSLGSQLIHEVVICFCVVLGGGYVFLLWE